MNERLKQIARLARQNAAADSAHDFSHCLRVLANALRIAEAEGGDPEVLTAAAFLHDISNLPKNHPESHLSSERSAARACEIVAPLAFPPEKMRALGDAILCHSYSRGLDPQTLEGRVFQDADRLDALGAIGVARTFAVGGALNRKMYSLEDPFTRLGRTPDDKDNTVDHFFVKLFKLGGKMQTPTGQKLARERLSAMQSFMDQLESEIGPEFELE